MLRNLLHPPALTGVARPRNMVCEAVRITSIEDRDMSALTQSRVFGGAMAATSLAAVLIGMSAMDHRVHEQVSRAVNGGGLSPEMASATHRLQEAVFAALDAVRDSSMDHAPLTIFALAAMVLLLFMLRT
jgi:hypothetical protein